jgi:hypothetical protein
MISFYNQYIGFWLRFEGHFGKQLSPSTSHAPELAAHRQMKWFFESSDEKSLLRVGDLAGFHLIDALGWTNGLREGSCFSTP